MDGGRRPCLSENDGVLAKLLEDDALAGERGDDVDDGDLDRLRLLLVVVLLREVDEQLEGLLGDELVELLGLAQELLDRGEELERELARLELLDDGGDGPLALGGLEEGGWRDNEMRVRGRRKRRREEKG